MAYTRTPWDPTTPAGSSQVSAGDNEIRAIKQDILERLESFFEDIDADPLVPKSGSIDAITAVEDKVLMIHPLEGQFPSEASAWTLDDTEIEQGGNARRYSLTAIPVGCVITNIKCYVNRGSGTNVNLKIKSATVGLTHTSTDHWDVTESDAGDQEVDSGTISITIEDNKAYFLQVNGNNVNQFYGARIVYNSPGLSAVR